MAPVPGPVFYPKYLDLTEEESARYLRQIELEAYAGIISALRSQGDLNKEKRILLTEICACLGISTDRHKAEIRRAVNDEKLSTIALHNSGSESSMEWIKEGRRIIPLPHRPLQITAYMNEANRVAEIMAAENAALPHPLTTGFRNKKHIERETQDADEKPSELVLNVSTKFDSSLYCAKCLSSLNQSIDADTSTEDLNPNERKIGIPSLGIQVPSASDSYVFLPGGTTIRVALGKNDKDDNIHDAYSMKPSFADFGNAPDINLAASRPSKRKRKKSVGSTQTKDNNLTIKQVLKPNAKPETLQDLYLQNNPETIIYDDERMQNFSQGRVKSEVDRYAQPTIRRKISDDARQKVSREPPTKTRKKKSPPPVPDTIQHTPVPPEHLYAAGANTRMRHQRPLEDGEAPGMPRSRPEYSVSTQQSPTKHLGQFSSRISPLSPSYYPQPGSASWSSSNANIVSRELPTLPETVTTYSRGFRYSPTKSFYKPPNIVQNTYGKSQKVSHSKRYRSSASTYSFTKKAMQAEIEHQSNLKRLTAKKDIGRVPTSRHSLDDMTQTTARMPFRPQFHQTGSYGEPALQPMEDSNTLLLPVLDTNNDVITESRSSSSLEELASVSLMASAISSSSIIETGLAPVSAIVSRVSSPAPGQLSSTPVARKSNKPMILSRIQNEEGGQPVRLIQHPVLGHSNMTVGPTRQGSTFVNVLREPTTSLTLSGAKIKNTGSIVSISGQHPVHHQVRLAGSSSSEMNIPMSFTPNIPMSITSQSILSPRIISSVSAKPHTLLKSTAGNVITVTAKPMPGMKSQSTLVSGASIVKPQIGQKTSIIVVHKASGTKLGKNTGFQTISTDGSKVITVSTKNLATSTVDLPRLPTDGSEDITSASALGSIQGLVSGLNPSGLVQKTKMIGTKPKFVTMHKKTIVGKIGDTATRAKVIQNLIRAPGKVLLKTTPGATLSSGQLRTFSGGRIVRPVLAQPGIPIPTAQILPGQANQDIVAAALSQSLGATIVNPSLPNMGKQEGSSVSGIIKVSTSTPAASTIKAFAANYQKNTSTGQIQMVTKPLSSITTISPSRQEKPKVFLSTSPSQSRIQPMLFTPHQPQVHRSPQGIGQKPRPTLIRSGATVPLSGQHTMMKVKVIGSAPSSSQLLTSQWQSTTVLGKGKLERSLDEISSDTKVLQNSSVIALPTSSAIQSHPPTMTTSDRATFIYQYHPNTPRSITKTVPTDQLSLASADNSDVIMLRTISSSTSTKPRTEELLSEPNLVKISLPSISTTADVGMHGMAKNDSVTLNKQALEFGKGIDGTESSIGHAETILPDSSGDMEF